MRRPNSAHRDQSVGAKWNEIKDYETDLNLTGGGGGRTASADMSTERSGTPRSSLTTREKFIQFKKQSSLRLSNIRNQLSGKYRRAGDEDARSEVSTTPSGEPQLDSSGSVNCTSMKSFGSVGRGIRTSKSLQNLEQITKDGWRQMADKTSYFGQNLKHRYSSKVDINKLAPKMNYESLAGDDSDEENRPTDELF